MPIIKGVIEVTHKQVLFLRRKYNRNITPEIDRRERAEQIRQELGLQKGLYRVVFNGKHVGLLGV